MNAGWLFIGGMLIAGLLLLIRGWRGRKVGDHPHCRGCEFDLYGLPPDAASCPECGQNIATPQATLRGAKQRGRKMIAIGLVLLIFGGLSGGFTIWWSTSQASIYAHLPSECLIWLVDDPDAREELIVRLGKNELSPSTISHLIDLAWNAQTDQTQPWDTRWSKILELAHSGGYASDAQIQQIERSVQQSAEGITLALMVRPKVQLGRTPQGFLWLKTDQQKLGPFSTVDCIITLNELSVDSQVMQLSPSTVFAIKPNVTAVCPVTLLLAAVGQHLGPVPIEAEATIMLLPRINGRAMLARPTKIATQRLKVEVLVMNEPTGQYIREDPTATNESHSPGVWIIQDIGYERLLVSGPSNNLGWEYYTYSYWLRVDGVVVRLSQCPCTVSFPAQYSCFDIQKILKTYPAIKDKPSADLIVRPDIDSAETRVDMPPVRLREWVFEDIPLNAAPVKTRFDDTISKLPTLAPVRTRVLTLEEAQQPPSDSREESAPDSSPR